MKKNHNCKITLNEAIDDQTELKILISNLNNDYNPRIKKKNRREKKSFKICKELTDVRDEIIDLFEKGIFPFKGNIFKTKEEESEENKLEKIKDDYEKFIKYTEDKSKGINYELFEKYFYFLAPTVLAKNKTKDKKRKTMS